ncbi:hypothetical protein PRIPAC_77788 [Pristionchus pacificus]|uniref:Uncharacterized protein n=1 Tax=Pristionchus pacificus TaxID=54126 RepID=A0A2A6CP26_PRIPA|nr:hypothetical protein PRIPAC_77788 [Pristionchus pacificus]|eukprot:PDM79889.1 hypothetical protein PRIPAC_32468 [Pristionchus pacificus]
MNDRNRNTRNDLLFYDMRSAIWCCPEPYQNLSVCYLSIEYRARRIYWPISVFLLNPFVIFVVARKTFMSPDCKAAYVCHHILLIGFDVYNGLLYRMYTLAPMPIFVCTGVLCTEDVSPRLLLTIQSFWTIAMCVPYLFIMLRMHQKMMPSESPFILSKRTQCAVLIVLYATLVTNVYGFAAWSTESSKKAEILNQDHVRWIKTVTDNCLVLGARPGDIGDFGNELVVLLFSVVINFTFYVFIIYQVVFKIGKQIALLTCIFFFSPLVMLFIMLRFGFTSSSDVWLPYVRFVFLMLYSLPSLYHSIVFIVKSPWCIQQLCRYSLKSITEQSTVLRLS